MITSMRGELWPVTDDAGRPCVRALAVGRCAGPQPRPHGCGECSSTTRLVGGTMYALAGEPLSIESQRLRRIDSHLLRAMRSWLQEWPWLELVVVRDAHHLALVNTRVWERRYDLAQPLLGDSVSS
jgi:hypothetical protein